MKRSLLILPLAAIWATNAHAGGLYLYETGGEDVGLAAAGMAARAQDASTILGNPAGMSRLEGDQLSMGAQLLLGDETYHLNDDNQLSGDSPGDILDPFPAASFFYSHAFNDKFAAGVGMYGNYGLSLNYGNWAGDRLVRKATLTALSLQPSASYRLAEQWSVGAGVGLNYGVFALKRNVADGEEKVDDEDFAANAHLGVLFELSEHTRFGLKYTSETEYDFSVSPTVYIPQLGQSVTLPLSAFVNTPQQLMFSAYHDLNEKVSILGNLGWQDWSSYSSDSEITVAGVTVPSSGLLRDTWHAALGAQYHINADWHLNGGVAYDSSMYKDQDNTSLTMPSGETWRFGVGAQYQLSEHTAIGTSFEYANVDGSEVQSALFGGSYDDGNLYFICMNYSYRF